MSLMLRLTELAHEVETARERDDVIEQMVLAARAEGATWEQIGDALGRTRQAAHHKYGRQDAERP
jgi:hypothetical protein